MTQPAQDIDMRLLKLHQEIRATREIVEVLRREVIKLEKRLIKLETATKDQ